MSNPRTPREAKQQFLDDLIEALRATPAKPENFLAENRRIIVDVAKRHGLTIPPPKTP